jgi:hypothetical protein
MIGRVFSCSNDGTFSFFFFELNILPKLMTKIRNKKKLTLFFFFAVLPLSSNSAHQKERS